MRTLTLDMLENRSNGLFIAGEDMVSFRQGKEIVKGKQAYLMDGHICVNEKDAVELYNILNKEDILDE